jgi:hypothetical protein
MVRGVVVGGGRREGLGEGEGSVLSLYILGVIARRIDVVLADGGLPAGRTGGVGVWVRGRWVVGSTCAVSGCCTVETIAGAGGDDGVGVGVLATFVGALGGAAGGRHGGVEGCELLHHLLVEIWLVCVYGLGMLAKIVEAGKLFGAVALEGAFAGVLSNGRGE